MKQDSPTIHGVTELNLTAASEGVHITGYHAAVKLALDKSAESGGGGVYIVWKKGISEAVVFNGKLFEYTPYDPDGVTNPDEKTEPGGLFEVVSVPRPDTVQDEYKATASYLLNGLNEIINDIPLEARLPGSPDLLEQVRHIVKKYAVLLDKVLNEKASAAGVRRALVLPHYALMPNAQRVELKQQIENLAKDGYTEFTSVELTAAGATVLTFTRPAEPNPSPHEGGIEDTIIAVQPGQTIRIRVTGIVK